MMDYKISKNQGGSSAPWNSKSSVYHFWSHVSRFGIREFINLNNDNGTPESNLYKLVYNIVCHTCFLCSFAIWSHVQLLCYLVLVYAAFFQKISNKGRLYWGGCGGMNERYMTITPWPDTQENSGQKLLDYNACSWWTRRRGSRRWLPLFEGTPRKTCVCGHSWSINDLPQCCYMYIVHT